MRDVKDPLHFQIDVVCDIAALLAFLLRLTSGPEAASSEYYALDRELSLQAEEMESADPNKQRQATSADFPSVLSMVSKRLLLRECLWIDHARLLSYQREGEATVPPSLLRKVLEDGLHIFPENPQLFSAFVVCESRSRIAGRVRRLVDTLAQEAREQQRATMILPYMAVVAESLQPVLPIHRLRALLERFCTDHVYYGRVARDLMYDILNVKSNNSRN